MDAHVLRLNHMSYHNQQQAHLLNSSGRANNQLARTHYSQRQQQQQQLESTRLANHKQQKSLSSAGSSGGSETNDEHIQLSSQVSSATNKTTSSSQVAMLAHGPGKHAASSSQQQLLLRQQHQQHLQQQQQKQRQQAMHGQVNHRQAALAAHNLQVPAGTGKSGSNNNNSSGSGSSSNHHQQQHHQQQVDQLTTSSSSEHTIDELHQLAHGYSQHRLAAGAAALRYGSEPSSSGGSQSGSRFLLGVLFTLAELLLFTTALLWLYWAYQYDDGLAWQSDRKQQFNTHAALMLLGFVFLNGQAMLIYRSFQCCSKIYTKILHTILFVLATSAISLGLILGYTAQENVGPNNKPIMHFYSLHAWCGLATVGLFALQFVFGFVSFLILLCCDSATSKFRAALLPIHKTFGLIIFSLAVATSLMGLLQTARSRLSSKLNKVDYHELAQASIVINLIGVCLICLAILMPYIIRNLDIKRPFRSELERHLKLSQLEMRI